MFRPILFNAEPARAILEGRKTVTRRDPFQTPPDYDVLKGHYRDSKGRLCAVFQCRKDLTTEAVYARYDRGDILWVRETWQEVYETEWSEEDPSGINIRELILNFDSIPKVEAGISSMCKSELMKPRMKYFVFKASNIQYADNENGLAWRPSIHMPKEAARIFLKVTDVHVERLQEITAEGALDEGTNVEFPEPKTSYISLAYTKMRLEPAARRSFANLWNSTIKPADLPVCGWQADPWVWVIRFERCERPEMGARA